MSHEQIPGFSGFLHIYDEAVERAKDGAIFVEVGVALGHSIAYLARKVLDSGKKIEVWAVDPWEGVARNGEQQEMADREPGGDFGLFCRMMLEHDPEALSIIRVLRTTSLRAANFFGSTSPLLGMLDLVLIDGAHDFESVRNDISYWLPLVKLGGTLAGDDHEPKYPGVQQACEYHFGGLAKADGPDTLTEGAGYIVRGTAWEVRR